MSWENRFRGSFLNPRVLSSAQFGTGPVHTAAALVPHGSAHLLPMLSVRGGKLTSERGLSSGGRGRSGDLRVSPGEQAWPSRFQWTLAPAGCRPGSVCPLPGTEAALGTAQPCVSILAWEASWVLPPLAGRGLEQAEMYLLLLVDVLAQYPEHPWPGAAEFTALC